MKNLNTLDDVMRDVDPEDLDCPHPKAYLLQEVDGTPYAQCDECKITLDITHYERVEEDLFIRNGFRKDYQ